MTYFWLFLLFFILLSDVRIVVKNKYSDTDVYIHFLYFFKIHIDYDEFIKKINVLKNANNSIESTLKDIKTIISSKKIIKKMLSKITIEVLEIDKVVNVSGNINIFPNLMFYISTAYLSKYLETQFLMIDQQQYELVHSNSRKNEFDFLIQLKVNFFSLLGVIILNFLEIIKIVRKRSAVNESSS